MPTLEFIDYVPHRAVVNGNTVSWVRDKAIKPINGLPQLFWLTERRGARQTFGLASVPRLNQTQDGSGCHAASAQVRCVAGRNRAGLEAFSSGESQARIGSLAWGVDCPTRGRQVVSVNREERMASTIRFYRFAWVAGFIDKRSPIWQDKQVVLRCFGRWAPSVFNVNCSNFLISDSDT